MKLSRLQGVFIALFVFLVSFYSADLLINSAGEEVVSVQLVNDAPRTPALGGQCDIGDVAQCDIVYAAANEFIKKDFVQTEIAWYKHSMFSNVITQSVIEGEQYFKNQKFYEQVYKPEMYQLRKSYPLRC